jgi:hypothetical protein
MPPASERHSPLTKPACCGLFYARLHLGNKKAELLAQALPSFELTISLNTSSIQRQLLCKTRHAAPISSQKTPG